MGWPVVIVTSGGIPVTEVSGTFGTPVEVATNGFGQAVTLVASGGLPVIGTGGGVDPLAPGAPSTPDMQAASDLGASSTDNITNDDTPTFDNVPPTGFGDARDIADGDVLSQEISDSPSFTGSATTIDAGIVGGGTIPLTPSTLPDGPYYTRSRVLRTGHNGPYSGTLQFTVDKTAPTITSSNSASRIEGGTTGGTLTATDAGGLAASPYSVSGGDSASITLNAASGAWTFNSPTDYETKTSYSWTFAVTDKAGNQATQAFTFVVINDPADDVVVTERDLFIGDDFGQSLNSSTGTRTIPMIGGYAET